MSARHVIVGSGVAALSAALALRQADPQAAITLISDDPHGYYSRPGLAYYLADEIPEAMLFPLRGKDDQGLRAERISGKAAAVLPEPHRVLLEDGRTVEYDRLLLATGAQAAMPDVLGLELEGVVKLDHLEDARRILRLARKARSAVVVGGGITALELVEGLRCRGLHVHYLLRGDRYWSNVLDETESEIIARRLKAEKVHLHFHTELECIEGSRGRVQAVLTRGGHTLRCELVAFAIGVLPRTELAQKAGLKVERGIVVDHHLRTSHPDIYAAGDVAQVYNPRTGRSDLDTLWNLARQQGRAAGLNMGGASVEYLKPPAINVTRLVGLPTTIVGAVGRGRDDDLVAIARGDSETWRHLPDATAVNSDARVNRLRLLIEADHLIGAVVMGDQTLVPALQALILERTDLTEIRGQLEDPRVPAVDLITRFCAQRRMGYAGKFT